MRKDETAKELGIPERIRELKLTKAHLESAEKEVKEFRDELESDARYIEEQVDKCDPGVPTEVDILRERLERSYHYGVIDGPFYTIIDLSIKGSIERFEDGCVCSRKE